MHAILSVHQQYIQCLIRLKSQCQLSCLEDVGNDEKLSDSNDAEFEIELVSVHKGFDQHEISDLAGN